MAQFLPVSRADMQARGWEQCDFVYIIGFDLFAYSNTDPTRHEVRIEMGRAL